MDSPLRRRLSPAFNYLNLHVQATEAGNPRYYIVDVFTTFNGSWEPADGPLSVPQWARDSYLRPLGAPDYFDDAGGDHHLFARVEDADGKPVATEVGFMSTDQVVMRSTGEKKSGWANIPIWSSYHPARGEKGSWSWAPESAAERIVGGGLPYNRHVSTFVVWRESRTGVIIPEPEPISEPDPDPPSEPSGKIIELVIDEPSVLRVRAKAEVVMIFNPND